MNEKENHEDFVFRLHRRQCVFIWGAKSFIENEFHIAIANTK